MDVIEPEYMEKLYEKTLLTYKYRLEDITEQKTRTTIDLQENEEKVRTMHAESVRLFNEFLDREREVATGLIYAKTGRRIMNQTINEMLNRQVQL